MTKTYTVSQAAEILGVSQRTLRRKLVREAPAGFTSVGPIYVLSAKLVESLKTWKPTKGNPVGNPEFGKTIKGRAKRSP